MDIWMHALSEFGFPMTITFYLLYRMEKKLDRINESILKLHERNGRPELPIPAEEYPEESRPLS